MKLFVSSTLTSDAYRDIVFPILVVDAGIPPSEINQLTLKEIRLILERLNQRNGG
ncbi:hypothetical protein HMPREF0044_0130 [Gleimia coleocanis DSM 15436]|uniref:Uncharacterized protein n=1 Tax=Gleimia coleocanis DSM 15436 TaxID=525245 RepID=C0VY90_9ACTO|nr:hypothetical protein HMPREF0044_0130 [Gleimia coleocanis DSM 15436]